MSRPPIDAFVLIANAAGRRARLFRRALGAAAVPHAVLDHGTLLSEGVEDALAHVAARWGGARVLVRLDTISHDRVAERALLARGYADVAALPRGPEIVEDARARAAGLDQLVGPRQRHLGLLSYLAELERVVAEFSGWTWQRSPAGLRRLLDRDATWMHHEHQSVPARLPEQHDAPAIFAEMRARGWNAAFMQLRWATPLPALAVLFAKNESVITSIEQTPGGRVATPTVRQKDGADARAIVRFLLREGAHVEHAIRKRRANDRYSDLRFLCVEGAPSFGIVRTNTQPLTSPRFGGSRADPISFRKELGEASWQVALELARASAQLHEPRSPGAQLELDIAFDSKGRPRLLGVDGFGDLAGKAADGVAVYTFLADRLGARRLDIPLRMLGPTGN